MKSSTAMRQYFFFFVLLMGLSGCQEQLIFSDNLPVVRAYEPSAISSGGATLEGEVLFSPSQSVKDFGVIWSGSPTFSADSVYRAKLSLGEQIDQKAYSIPIGRDLLPERTYYYRYYIETDEALTHSNIVSFESQGSIWNPWERPSQPIPGLDHLGNFQPVFLDDKVYLIGNYYQINVFDPQNQSWEVIEIEQALYPEPFFVKDGKAYLSIGNGSSVQERIKVVDIRTGDILQSYPLPEPLYYYPESYFWFCHGQYCYAYLRANAGLSFWKFDPTTFQSQALPDPPEFYRDNIKVQQWNDRPFVWSGQGLWEYLPGSQWEEPGEWVMRTTYPGAQTSFGPTAVFLSGDKLIAGWPKEAPFEQRNELWEYSMSDQQWGLSHLAPGPPGSSVKYQVETPRGYFFVLALPQFFETELWYFSHDKFYKLD